MLSSILIVTSASPTPVLRFRPPVGASYEYVLVRSEEMGEAAHPEGATSTAMVTVKILSRAGGITRLGEVIRPAKVVLTPRLGRHVEQALRRMVVTSASIELAVDEQAHIVVAHLIKGDESAMPSVTSKTLGVQGVIFPIGPLYVPRTWSAMCSGARLNAHTTGDLTSTWQLKKILKGSRSGTAFVTWSLAGSLRTTGSSGKDTADTPATGHGTCSVDMATGLTMSRHRTTRVSVAGLGLDLALKSTDDLRLVKRH